MARSREARKGRRIRALRILLLIALVGTVGGLVAFLVRERLEREPPPQPTAVGPEGLEATGETVTVGEGFERTVTEGDRSLFTVRGERYSVTRSGLVHLEGVGITVYDDRGTAYNITSPEATFQPERRQARLIGGVELTGPNGLQMVTDELRVIQRGRIILSHGQIYVRFGDRFHARADQLRVELYAQRFHMVGHARILSLPGSPVPFEMTTRLLTIDRSRHMIEGDDGPVEIHHLSDWLSAIHVFVFLDEHEQRVQYIRARDRVVAELRSSEALGRVVEPIEVPAALAETSGEAATEGQEEATDAGQTDGEPPAAPAATEEEPAATGGMESAATGEAPAATEEEPAAAPVEDQSATAEGAAPETEGTPPVAEASPAAPETEQTAPAAPADQGAPTAAPEQEQQLGRIVVRAEHLEIEVTPDGTQAQAIHLEGGPDSPAALRSFVINHGPVHRLLAPKIDGTFVDGRPAKFVAGEDVGLIELDRDPESVAAEIQEELGDQHGKDAEEEADGAPNTPQRKVRLARRAKARQAQATFDAAGELSSVTLLDRVEITDTGPPGGEGQTKARGDRAVFHLDTDTMELTGVPATVVSPRGTMEAPKLEYTRADGILHGTEGVRAKMAEGAETALGGTPLAQGEGPVWVEADQGFLRDAPRSFLFLGSVRAWRGTDLLTADQLRGDDAEQSLAASGHVRSLWTPAEEDEQATGPAGDGPLEVNAEEMVFHQEDGILTYTGDVVADQQERVLRCQKMELFLHPEEGAAATPAGEHTGTFDKLICTGEVEVTDPPTETGGGRTLTGHRAVYLPGARTVEVEAAADGKVTMKDRDGNVLEGPRMIYEIDNDKVQVLPSTEEAPAANDSDGGGKGSGEESQ